MNQNIEIGNRLFARGEREKAARCYAQAAMSDPWAFEALADCYEDTDPRRAKKYRTLAHEGVVRLRDVNIRRARINRLRKMGNQFPGHALSHQMIKSWHIADLVDRRRVDQQIKVQRRMKKRACHNSIDGLVMKAERR